MSVPSLLVCPSTVPESGILPQLFDEVTVSGDASKHLPEEVHTELIGGWTVT